MEAIIELLKKPGVRLTAGDTWLVWDDEDAKWEVYYHKPRQHGSTRVISTRSEDAAAAAFIGSAGIEEEER